MRPQSLVAATEQGPATDSGVRDTGKSIDRGPVRQELHSELLACSRGTCATIIQQGMHPRHQALFNVVKRNRVVGAALLPFLEVHRVLCVPTSSWKA